MAEIAGLGRNIFDNGNLFLFLGLSVFFKMTAAAWLYFGFLF